MWGPWIGRCYSLPGGNTVRASVTDLRNLRNKNQALHSQHISRPCITYVLYINTLRILFPNIRWGVKFKETSIVPRNSTEDQILEALDKKAFFNNEVTMFMKILKLLFLLFLYLLFRIYPSQWPLEPEGAILLCMVCTCKQMYESFCGQTFMVKLHVCFLKWQKVHFYGILLEKRCSFKICIRNIKLK